ncbi:YciI family protein [Chachezhania sediminis]|uniref:YciI family protein n=1 Tax=Chachezhania sediminis TaxID=2599291 RepID=UPI00131D60EC|nr:YciI family protein [Chachezhania sediminis]
MTDYLFVYHGGAVPRTPEEGQKAMEAWGDWFGALGDALVIPGNAVGASRTVTSSGVTDDGGPNPASGFTVVKADSLEAAIEMAKGCPMVIDGSGSVEVAPIIEM